jgi:hypothetical protein
LWTDIKKKLLVREALPPRKFLPFGVWDFVVRQMKQPERFIVPRGRSYVMDVMAQEGFISFAFTADRKPSFSPGILDQRGIKELLE